MKKQLLKLMYGSAIQTASPTSIVNNHSSHCVLSDIKRGHRCALRHIATLFVFTCFLSAPSFALRHPYNTDEGPAFGRTAAVQSTINDKTRAMFFGEEEMRPKQSPPSAHKAPMIRAAEPETASQKCLHYSWRATKFLGEGLWWVTHNTARATWWTAQKTGEILWDVSKMAVGSVIGSVAAQAVKSCVVKGLQASGLAYIVYSLTDHINS